MSLTILGDAGARSGSYLLLMQVKTAVSVTFGRFAGGRPISVPAGGCVYVGSAMGESGAGSLARRLLRHATRSGERPPHPIRANMLTTFPAIGLAHTPLHPPQAKTCRWHIDYLLDHEAVTLTDVIILRSRRRWESKLAQWLMANPNTFILQKGLGASDAAGETHLLGVTAVDAILKYEWQAIADSN